jgi:hypothetical protein
VVVVARDAVTWRHVGKPVAGYCLVCSGAGAPDTDVAWVVPMWGCEVGKAMSGDNY